MSDNNLESYEQRRRRIILDAAQAEFINHGYKGTSLAAIIDNVGGSKSTIYTYFGNKAELFAAVVKRTADDAEAPSLTLDGHNIRTPLLGFAEKRLAYVLSPENIRIMRLVIAEADRFPGIGEVYFNHAPDITYKRLESFFQEACKRHLFETNDIKRTTERFIGPLLMRPLLARLYGVMKQPSSEKIREMAQSHVDDFLACQCKEKA